MPTLNDHTARTTILARLDRLSPEAAPRWGTMTAPRMLAHISDSFRMAFGELSVAAKRVPLARHFPIKHLVLYVLPFPKNAPTAREIISRMPDDFDVERSRVRQLAERMDGSVTGVTYATHPIFGALTPREWGVLGYKHLDHHLRQFGV